jgi:hypothetical protein
MVCLSLFYFVNRLKCKRRFGNDLWNLVGKIFFLTKDFAMQTGNSKKSALICEMIRMMC